MKIRGLGKKLLVVGALSGALVLGTVIPANATYYYHAGPYKSYTACKTAERAYISSWSKITSPCYKYENSNRWGFMYTTVYPR